MSNKKPIVDMSDLNREDFSKKEWKQIYDKRFRSTDYGNTYRKKSKKTEAYREMRKKYRASEHGKLVEKLYSKSQSRKDCVKRYDQSKKGRLGQKRRRQTEAHKISQKRYNQSLKGKTTRRLKKYQYRAKKLNSNVSWGNEESIKLIYQEAVRKTEETGIQYDVDHFIPLQGKNVSGLHVEGNLRVMLHTDNCSKQNIFTPEMEQSVILEMVENE